MDLNSECIFCKIAAHEADATVLHEEDDFMIIKDIMPKAPVHAQVISKRHIPTTNDLTEQDVPMVGRMLLAARNYAKEAGIADRGFKIVINTGKEGGMIIPHLHMHLLGGKQLEE